MGATTGKDDRKARLAQQLRANLRRRKEQSRGRAAEQPAEDASPQEGGAAAGAGETPEKD